MDNKDNINIFWFRRDLRLHDNHGLYRALASGLPVLPVFIFDKNILDELPSPDPRVQFIYDQTQLINKKLLEMGNGLKIIYSTPKEAFLDLLNNYNVKDIYANKDYEPYALDRDQSILKLAESKSASLNLFKDHVVYEQDEVLSNSNTPYTVFTPYKKKWLLRLNEEGIPYYPSEENLDKLYKIIDLHSPSLRDIGFEPSDIDIPNPLINKSIIRNYDKTRNYPALAKGTSRLGIHFRFGTISIREKVNKAKEINETYLSELIWRDFYSQIIYHFPHVVDNAFRAKYDKIMWRDSDSDYNKWCLGQTGYPLVDAGMRELNATGHMHNRVRMVVASFLTKHLLIDWRRGEAYFAAKLLDFDLASNNGGWQWASGSGTDAAPYFRIFNPTSQLEKFDKELIYVKKWVPEYGTDQYPDPMVDHKFARERCLETYKSALN